MTEINDLLKFDPLAEAERLTGSSYKDSAPTAALGMLLMVDANARIKEEMSQRDDTHYGVTFADALRILGDLGFKEIHAHDFHPAVMFADEPARTEKFVILWRAGVLAKITSYGERVNNFDVYYNWEPNEDVTCGRVCVTSSPGWSPMVDSWTPGWSVRSCGSWTTSRTRATTTTRRSLMP